MAHYAAGKQLQTHLLCIFFLSLCMKKTSSLSLYIYGVYIFWLALVQGVEGKQISAVIRNLQIINFMYLVVGNLEFNQKNNDKKR